MATNVFRGTAKAVAQVWKATIGSTTVGHTFTLTMTDDNGETSAVTYTAIGGDTIDTIAAGLIALVTANCCAFFGQVIAATTSGSGNLTLTSTVVGRPFSVATSGTGTWTSPGTTTASSGPNDASCAENWSLGAIPVGTNDIVFPAGHPAVLYGLNFSAVTMASVKRYRGGLTNIGRYENGVLHSFRCGCTSIDIKGGGTLVAFDIGSSAIAVRVQAYGTSGVIGLPAINIKGSAITTVTQYDDTDLGYTTVGIAMGPGETATVTGGGEVYGRGEMHVGGGVTVTGTTFKAYGAAKIRSEAAIPTIIGGDGCVLEALAAFTTTSIGEGATLRILAGGTFATVNTYRGVIEHPNSIAATITTCNVSGPSTLLDPTGTVTITTENKTYGGLSRSYSSIPMSG